jgi:hypothetical protein
MEARAWITHIDLYESLYDACFKADPEFGARILGLIDLTFFQLCDTCARAQSIKDVDFTVIALHNKRFDILQLFSSEQTSIPYVYTKEDPLEGEEGGNENSKDGKKI